MPVITQILIEGKLSEEQLTKLRSDLRQTFPDSLYDMDLTDDKYFIELDESKYYKAPLIEPFIYVLRTIHHDFLAYYGGVKGELFPILEICDWLLEYFKDSKDIRILYGNDGADNGYLYNQELKEKYLTMYYELSIYTKILIDGKLSDSQIFQLKTGLNQRFQDYFYNLFDSKKSLYLASGKCFKTAFRQEYIYVLLIYCKDFLAEKSGAKKEDLLVVLEICDYLLEFFKDSQDVRIFYGNDPEPYNQKVKEKYLKAHRNYFNYE